MNDQPAPPSAKERAISIMAEIATTRANLQSAIADFQRQAIELNAAISKAAAPHQERLDLLKVEAEALGLAECEEVFGAATCSFISNGLALKLSESEAVSCDEAVTLKRLLKEAGKAHLIIDPDDTAQTDADRMAASACLRIKVELNKAYIQAVYDDFTEWFNSRGIVLEPTKSVKLADAPKTRTPKTKTVKGAKRSKEDGSMQPAAETQQEAA